MNLLLFSICFCSVLLRATTVLSCSFGIGKSELFDHERSKEQDKSSSTNLEVQYPEHLLEGRAFTGVTADRVSDPLSLEEKNLNENQLKSKGLVAQENLSEELQEILKQSPDGKFYLSQLLQQNTLALLTEKIFYILENQSDDMKKKFSEFFDHFHFDRNKISQFITQSFPQFKENPQITLDLVTSLLNEFQQKLPVVISKNVHENFQQTYERIKSVPDTISKGLDVVNSEFNSLAQMIFLEIKDVILEKKSLPDAVLDRMDDLEERSKQLIARAVSNSINYFGQNASEDEVRAYLSDKKKRIIDTAQEKKAQLLDALENYTAQKKVEFITLVTENKKKMIDQVLDWATLLINTAQDFVANNYGKIIVLGVIWLFLTCLWCLGWFLICLYILRSFNLQGLLKRVVEFLENWLNFWKNIWNLVFSSKKNSFSKNKNNQDEKQTHRNSRRIRKIERSSSENESKIEKTSHRNKSKDLHLEERIKHIEKLLRVISEKIFSKRTLFPQMKNKKGNYKVMSKSSSYSDSISSEEETRENKNCCHNFTKEKQQRKYLGRHFREEDQSYFECKCGNVWSFQNVSRGKKSKFTSNKKQHQRKEKNNLMQPKSMFSKLFSQKFEEKIYPNSLRYVKRRKEYGTTSDSDES